MTSNRPIDAAAIPFPRAETTPPVTKMKRVSPAGVLFLSKVRSSAASECSPARDGTGGDRDPEIAGKMRIPARSAGG